MNIDKILETIEVEFKGRSVGKYGHCLYRHGNKKCAIGLFIPDSAVNSNSNDHGVSLLLEESPHLWEYMPSGNLRKLQAFQGAHDEGVFPNSGYMTEDIDSLSVDEQKMYLQLAAMELFY